jgi:hypothetical protein
VAREVFQIAPHARTQSGRLRRLALTGNNYLDSLTHGVIQPSDVKSLRKAGCVTMNKMAMRDQVDRDPRDLASVALQDLLNLRLGHGDVDASALFLQQHEDARVALRSAVAIQRLRYFPAQRVRHLHGGTRARPRGEKWGRKPLLMT